MKNQEMKNQITQIANDIKSGGATEIQTKVNNILGQKTTKIVQDAKQTINKGIFK